jgi:hypothetical protein
MPDCYSFDETAWLAIKKQICKDGMDAVTVKIRQSCVCCLATVGVQVGKDFPLLKHGASFNMMEFLVVVYLIFIANSVTIAGVDPFQIL